MKTYRYTLLLGCLLCGVISAFGARQVTDFNKEWKFQLNGTPPGLDLSFDDSAWRLLSLPHDWAIEGEFSESNPSGAGGGALPGGIGWYRKTFTVDRSVKGKKVFIDFDGVYMNSEVWINGHALGVRPYGYISFRYDLTPYLNYGDKNVITVKVDNSKQPNSRWYSGCGIYRNVWLVTTDPVYVGQWGTYVTTPEVSSQQATVDVVTTVCNDAAKLQAITLVTDIVDAKGKVVASSSQEQEIAQNSSADIRQQIALPNPHLWSVNDPYLYKVVSRLKADGAKDRYETPLGVRTFYFDRDKGFFLNGEPLKILGVCNHHDLGCLGAAVNTRAIERQLQILKEMGCNGIRCSHNPPAPELLDLCDKMGFIVQDESFDMWRKRKTTYDYSLYFNEWHERDLADHILRDRNHPSIFMWSVGNEVLEQWSNAHADTLSLEQANLLLNFNATLQKKEAKTDAMHVNSLLAIKLVDLVKSIDPTRPVTTGNNSSSPDNLLFRSGAMDIIGFNYNGGDWLRFHQNFPGQKLLITESTSGLMTRGYYRMPSDKMFPCPTDWDKPYVDSTYACSSYDHCYALWGSNHENSWKMVKKYDHISGMYIWTGFDYLGEPTPYSWPARSSYFGIVDLAGFPKDIYYLYQSEWRNDKAVLHVFPHWNWNRGDTVDIWAYYNQADEVELFLNGVSQGVRQKTEEQLHTVWRLAYEPGTVKVVSRKEGKEVLSREVKSAGEPARIELIADRSRIKSDGYDLSFISVTIVDAEGNLCPNADNQVSFTVEGEGKLAGADNGNPVSHENFKAPQRKAFYGKCLAVVQASEKRGKITLTASSPQLQGAKIEIKTGK